MSGAWDIADLGTPVRDDMWKSWRRGVDPRSGAPVALGCLSAGGFVLVDPYERRGLQVTPPEPLESCSALCQDARGVIYQCDWGQRHDPVLLAWDGAGSTSRRVTDVPVHAVVDMAHHPALGLLLLSAIDGSVWRVSDERAPARPWWAPRPAGAGRRLALGGDGVVYVQLARGSQEHVEAVGTDGNSVTGPLLQWSLDSAVAWHEVMHRTAAGGVYLHDRTRGRWYEARDARLHPLRAMPPALVRIDQWPSIGTAALGLTADLAFDDGLAIVAVNGRAIQTRDAAGHLASFEVPRRDPPVRLFRVAAAFGDIWGSSFIPLSLFHHDPATGAQRNLGNPTQSSSGEAYTVVARGDELLIGGYCNASITRYRPALPWRPGTDAQANPRELGLASVDPVLHRPRSAAVTAAGDAYFAAIDPKSGQRTSALARVDANGQLHRWIFTDREVHGVLAPRGATPLIVAWSQPSDGALMLGRFDPERGVFLREVALAPGPGSVTALLDGPDSTVFLLHDYRATLYRVDARTLQTLAVLPEVGLGDHCHDSLAWHGGRLVGLTNRALFEVDADLSVARPLATYPDHARGNFYRFGLADPGDGRLYFANGPHLMAAAPAR